MSSIELDRARTLAGTVFDEVVAPIGEARKAAGATPYFAPAPVADAKSYYQAPFARVMQPADFEFPGGGSAAGLIDALAAYWSAQGETELAAMAPRLHEIAEALKEEAVEGDGTVSVLCYTMF
jgi:hypothetical protein